MKLAPTPHPTNPLLPPPQDMLKQYFDGTVVLDGTVNDTRLVGTITLCAVLALAIVGMDWVTRVRLKDLGGENCMKYYIRK